MQLSLNPFSNKIHDFEVYASLFSGGICSAIFANSRGKNSVHVLVQRAHGLAVQLQVSHLNNLFRIDSCNTLELRTKEEQREPIT